MRISIVIPCYNEEKGIENLADQINPVIKKLKTQNSVELILVNDGSIDKTLILLNKYFKKKNYVKIISYKRNRNLGGALKEGFKYVTGDLVVTIDSDCTYLPREISYLIGLLDENTDIVTASPYHPEGKIINVKKHRLFLSKSISYIYSMLIAKGIYTYTAIFRVYKRKVIENIKIRSNGFISVAELLIFALLKGYKVKEFPITMYGREFGQSKIKTLKVIKEHIKLILYIVKIKLLKCIT